MLAEVHAENVSLSNNQAANSANGAYPNNDESKDKAKIQNVEIKQEPATLDNA